MIKNFFKSALRNLWKTKGYSFLNIFGLAVGITAASLIFLWVENEVTKNDHFPNKKDIYVVKSKQQYDGTTYVFEAAPDPLSAAIKNEIPGIKHAIRIQPKNSLFSLGDNSVYQNGYFIDPEGLDILSIEFISGDPAQALKEPTGIILSESGAERLFGKDEALGKTVHIDNNENYTVTAVVKDFPTNSNFRFNWLVNFKKYEPVSPWTGKWESNSLITLVQLEQNADLTKVNTALENFIAQKTEGKVANSQNFLYPMTRWNLYNNFDGDGHEKEGFIRYIRLFSTIAWVVLLIACINFMNLSTARSEKRAKEVGMRKVVGASRKALILQFLGESLLYAILSALLAIGFIYLSLGAFNSLINKDLSINLLSSTHLSFILMVVLVCGLFAGSYPAFYLSSFNPLKTLKGAKQKAGAAGFIRRGLVILQYTASVILIICTTIIYQQVQYAKNRDVGFDRSQVITTSLRGDMVKNIDIIKEQLKATGHIEQVGISDWNVLQINSNTGDFEWEGKAPDTDVLISILRTDEDFIPSMGMEFHDGRNFRSKFLGDSSSVIINEALAKMIQPEGMAAGKILRSDGESYTVIGVVKNFVYNNVFSASPEPLLFVPFNRNDGVVNIKTKAGVDLPQTIAQIEQIIQTNNPGFPFEYRFLDDTFNDRFYSEMLIQKLAAVFAVLSIIVSCLGLFGLASYSAEQRSKEIGIRKVLGASVTRLVGMLNKEFVALVAISCLIAFPIAWWFMHDWLRSYSYKIEIGWTVFVLAASVAIVIALLTISSQALRAATANPTKTLRDE